MAPQSAPQPAADSSAAAAAGLLAADEDRYDGIIVRAEELPADSATFKASLDRSLQAWEQQGKRGIWLKVPRCQSHLIPLAVEPGFVFHHAEEDYVMMTKWLPQGQGVACTLPPNASHQVGVGAFVVNEQQQVLVVQEANGPLRGQGFWKMPTGIVHQGEDLLEAVEREFFEETGLKASFEALLAVRQAHGFLFGKSDMFFCCGLRLADGEAAAQLKPCEREIAAVQWMPLQEYKSQPYFAKLPACYHTMLDACIAWAQGRYAGLQGRVFDGSAARPRRDLLLWGREVAAVEDAAASGAGPAAAAAAGASNDAVAGPVAAAGAAASTSP